jgi:GDP-4-dehydro-6-deoxy-D-mannose reductase
MKKRIFITGISGFVGSHLARHLGEKGGYEIFGTVFGDTRPLPGIASENLFQLNLLDREATREAVHKIQPHYVAHLAALSSPAQSFNDPRKTLTNNIEAQINVLDGLREVDVVEKILIIGSGDEYGMVAEEHNPIHEQVPLKPLNPYAVSKIAQDYLGLQYFLSFGLPVVRLRPFNHTGAGRPDVFVESNFAKQVALIEAGKQEPVVKVGNLEAVRDFSDVADMVRAYGLALEKGEGGEVYNLGSGKGVKIADLLDTLLSYIDTEVRIEQDPQRMRPSDTPKIICDASKFSLLTGWKTEIDFSDTLKSVLDYWRGAVTSDQLPVTS